MAQDDPLYKAFLAELEALEKFRIGYSGLHPHVPLSREDPDVRRMIEAMAMFTARTRRSAERSLGLSMLRLFRQHFPFMLSPMPSMGMLHAETSPRFVDTASVPRGSRVILSSSTSQATKPGATPPLRLGYRTLRPMRVLPIEIERLDMFPRELGGYRLVLTLMAAHDRVDAIERIDLYVNHLNDLASSLTVHHALAKHTQRAMIVFDQDVGDDTTGSPVSVRFGADPSELADSDIFAHPLERVRSLLHFPQQAMYLTARVSSQPRNWRKVSLALDLDARFPRELKLTADTFQLHVAPMVNLVRDMADPITYDATRDRYPILHPDVPARYRLHSVLGAYRLDKEEGLVPLRPGIVGEREQAYEIETDGVGEERMGFVTLDAPEAFAEPFRIAVDAQWHQPVLMDEHPPDLSVSLHDRYFDGLTWQCLGALSKPRESALGSDIDGLLSLLSLKNKRFLDRDELAFVLEALGGKTVPTFSAIVRAITDVRVESKPYARGTTGFKYVYTVSFGRLDASELPALELFSGQVLEALRAWSIDEVVELTVKVPSLEKTLQVA